MNRRTEIPQFTSFQTESELRYLMFLKEGIKYARLLGFNRRQRRDLVTGTNRTRPVNQAGDFIHSTVPKVWPMLNTQLRW